MPAPPARSPRSAPAAGAYGLLIVVMLLAGWLRFAGLTDHPLWFDEIWHAELSTGHGSAHLRLPTDRWLSEVPAFPSMHGAAPAWQVATHMDWVLHPPAYHLLLRGWRWGVAADSTFGLRALSATLSLLVVAAVVAMAWRKGGAGVALLVGALLAASSTQVNQAQDARGYTLLLLLTIAAVGVVGRWPRAPGRSALPDALLLAALCLAMMWTHYFALGACAGLAGYALITAESRRRRATLVAATLVAAAVWLALWWPTLRDQLRCVEETADIFLIDPQPHQPARTILRVAALPLRLVWSSPKAPLPLLAAGGAVIWVALLSQARRAPGVAPWAWVLAGTAALLAGLDLARGTRHLDFERYALLASPAAVLAVAATIAQMRPPTARVAVTILAPALLLAALPAGRQRTSLDPRPLVDHLLLTVDVGEPIVLVSPNPLGRDAQTLYLYLAWYVPALFPRDLYLATRPLDAPPTRPTWVVAANPGTDPARVWPGAVVESSWRDAGDPHRPAWGAVFRVLPAPTTVPAAP